MSNGKNLKVLGTALIVLFLMNSCTEFFSDSWGELFRRDPKKVKVDSSNVYDLLDAAKGDPDLSRAILDQINAGSKDDLKRAAITAANQAAEISTLALENISEIIEAMDSGDKEAALRKVIENIEKDIKSNDLVGISDKLNEILANKLKISQKEPGAALIAMKEIAAFVPMVNGDTAIVVISVDGTGAGTATITGPNGVPVTYSCVINNDGTITLTEGGNTVTTIECKVDADTNTLTLTGLNTIPGAGLTATSNPFISGKPGFAEDFLDGVSESDLTLSVITLILAKAEKERDINGTLEKYLETWIDKNVETGKGLDVEEALIAALINEMIERGDDTSELKDLLVELLGITV